MAVEPRAKVGPMLQQNGGGLKGDDTLLGSFGGVDDPEGVESLSESSVPLDDELSIGEVGRCSGRELADLTISSASFSGE